MSANSSGGGGVKALERTRPAIKEKNYFTLDNLSTYHVKVCR